VINTDPYHLIENYDPVILRDYHELDEEDLEYLGEGHN
jgi:hypothetical protein